MLQFENHSREIERQIIVLLVEDLLSAGFDLGVHNGEETELERSRDSAAIFSKMSTTDEDFIFVYSGARQVGWIQLVYGNDASVISNYITAIPETVFQRANELAKRFY
jgi:hypothetical protein